ncbi:MAG: oxygen-independent coproporphyrinogen III oxidase [Alphaproteobacteria bacterium]
MRPEEIASYDRLVPRYTSYPTAPHFTPAVGAARYRRWLAEVPAESALSLYLHVPFCAQLCWFCGCHTSVVNRYPPVAGYLDTLLREIDVVAEALGARRRATHLHWGGGTPTMLRPGDIRLLTGQLRARFDIAEDADFAVEIDPRAATCETVVALAEAGVTRASLGVQDFDPEVQRAVNRVQSFDLTRRVVGWLREHGIDALNVDLLYGLPEQTAAGLVASVDRTLELEPQRIALFGYAHVPWMKRHQRLIDESRLPVAVERARQAITAAARLVERGYVAIGLDHFALPGDGLAKAAHDGTLRRNFQGYTTDRADVLLGFGASAIGALPDGYVQNVVATPAYRKAIDGGALAVVRGVAIDADDRLRRDVIERLMCDLEVDLDAVCRAHGSAPAALAREVEALAPLVACGAVRVDGDVVRVMPEARLLLRLACAAFDRRLTDEGERHARAV